MKKNTVIQCIVVFAAVGACCVGAVFADDAAIDAKLNKLEQKVEAQAEQIKTLQAQQSSTQSASPSKASDTTIGGYGEIAYNGYIHDGQSGRNQADLKRFVIFLGHRFSDKWTFNSEVEWEHAVTSNEDQGEIEIEQAYLNYQVSPGFNMKTGLFLMPFGYLNENHEPPVFYGVERNEVETRIIPSTWREGGVSFDKITNCGIDVNVGLTTGFDIAKFDDESAPLSSVHQELQFAKTHDLSYYGALNYRGVPGFNVGGAYFSGYSGQGNADYKADNSNPDFSGINARVTLWETHTRFQKYGWDLQALYAEGTIGDVDKIDNVLQDYNTANPDDQRALVPKKFNGWLVQGAYMIWQRGDTSLTPFARFEQYDTQAKMPDNLDADPATKDTVTTVGFSFKPLTPIVFKSDYQSFRDNHLNDRINVGMGYMF